MSNATYGHMAGRLSVEDQMPVTDVDNGDYTHFHRMLSLVVLSFRLTVAISPTEWTSQGWDLFVGVIDWNINLLHHYKATLCSAVFPGQVWNISHYVAALWRIAFRKTIEMLIVHWENLSFPLCVKWKAFPLQCEWVIVGQAFVLEYALSCWARQFFFLFTS